MYFSFPIRLLLLHFRNHSVLIALWVLLLLFSGGILGKFYGLHYLMLTPEYRGTVDFWSFFLVGTTFGTLTMIWNLTTYLLSANRFAFLATLDAPFSVFCINNCLVPMAFLIAYLTASIWFQWHDELTATTNIIINISGFLSGTAVLILILASYLYFTNKDIGAFLRKGGKFYPKPGGRLLIRGQRLPTLYDIQMGNTRWRVDTYMNERIKPRLVRSVAHYPKEILEEVFKQNHFNAVTVQVFALVLLMTLGLFMDQEWARIPTGATIFILCSMSMAIFGAITFWFRQWGTLVFLGLLVTINFITGFGIFSFRNRAYGLNYEVQPKAAYNYARFEQQCSPENIHQDKANTLEILEKWLKKNQKNGHQKPKMILLCVSGGGMRSSLWTAQALQQVNIATNGKLWQNTALLTGASGGMLGASYLREALLCQQEGQNMSPNDPTLLDDLGKDLLNAVSFALVANDLFYPFSRFDCGGFTYRQDRGYLLEKQLNENGRNLFQRRLSEYRKAESDAVIPMMILSPFVINDGRRLLISPQPVSYLMRPPASSHLNAQMEIDGIDFGAFFKDYQSDSLLISSALRMNCTYPLILPNVWLPTDPAVEVMDAGLRDNFGLGVATRFAHCFSDWIKANTSGIVLIQIRCWNKVENIAKSDRKGMIENILAPASAATNMSNIQDYELDSQISMLQSILGPDFLQSIPFFYRPVRKQREASMSLHLSKREKIDIMEAFYSEENQQSLEYLKILLRH